VKILNTPEFVTRVYNVPLENISLGVPSYRTVAIMLSTLFVVSVMYAFIYISTFILYKKKEALDMYHESVEVDVKEPENTSLLHFIGFFNAFVFSLGLGCAGMTKPQKVLGFFDIGPHWDPSLFCIILFTILPSLVVFQFLILRREKPGLAPEFVLPTTNKITVDLIVGAVFFGTGWGLFGLCPGPLIANLTRNQWDFFLYGFLVVCGIYLYDLLSSIWNLVFGYISQLKNK
jgi:uncharacterized protein